MSIINPTPTPLTMTFHEWRQLGYVVKKGEKSVGKNSYNVAVFTEDQVTPLGRPIQQPSNTNLGDLLNEYLLSELASYPYSDEEEEQEEEQEEDSNDDEAWSIRDPYDPDLVYFQTSNKRPKKKTKKSKKNELRDTTLPNLRNIQL